VSVHFKLLLPALGLFAATALANETPVISKQLKQRAQTTINQFELSPEIQKKAEALRQFTSTEQYRQKQKDYEKRVAHAAGLGSLLGSKPQKMKRKNLAQTANISCSSAPASRCPPCAAMPKTSPKTTD
jgi:hypothetical protein